MFECSYYNVGVDKWFLQIIQNFADKDTYIHHLIQIGELI